jgi:hypothetical protein
MTTINHLTAQDTVAGGDQFAIWSAGQGDTRRTSAATLAAYVRGGLGLRAQVTEYAAPNATGFNVTLNTSDDVWLILTPSTGYAAGTVTLPANPADRQLVTVSCSQAVTSLTVAGNGNTVRGAPSTIAADGFFSMRFDDVTNVWIRVG